MMRLRHHKFRKEHPEPCSGNANHSTNLLLGGTVPLCHALSGCSLVKKHDLDDSWPTCGPRWRPSGGPRSPKGTNRYLRSPERAHGRTLGPDGRPGDDLASLEKDFDARVEELETALRFDAPIYFGFDEDEVNQEYMVFLDRFAEWSTATTP